MEFSNSNDRDNCGMNIIFLLELLGVQKAKFQPNTFQERC